MIYALIALAIIVGVYFLLSRKGSGGELAERTEDEVEVPRPRPAPRSVPPASSGTPVAPASSRGEAAAPEAPAPAREPEPELELPAPPRDVAALRRGLAKARAEEGFFGRLRALFSGKKTLSPELVAEIEEVLLTSDVGSETTALLLERVKSVLGNKELDDSERVWEALRDEAERILSVGARMSSLDLRARPSVVLMVGVNGAGKTTTIGKLATKLRANKKSVVLAAGDTFRAAAVQQLVVWGDRTGCEVVRGKDGADPGSVVFDAIRRAQEVGADVVLADTAGRLHTKSNLMAEMKKIAKTAEKALAGAPHEILLVIDATNGQNATAQAKEFKEALPLSGIVLTKLDGTAKGGVVLGIAHSLELPVRFVGLGERPDDLHEFMASDFVEALLGREAEH